MKATASRTYDFVRWSMTSFSPSPGLSTRNRPAWKKIAKISGYSQITSCQLLGEYKIYPNLARQVVPPLSSSVLFLNGVAFGMMMGHFAKYGKKCRVNSPTLRNGIGQCKTIRSYFGLSRFFSPANPVKISLTWSTDLPVRFST